jgi:hypothetical protein
MKLGELIVGIVGIGSSRRNSHQPDDPFVLAVMMIILQHRLDSIFL